jgi:PAS domain S-box-containing protein
MFQLDDIRTILLEHTPLGIIITDLTGSITYVNKYFTKLTGYTEEELLGQNPRILRSGKHDEWFYKNLWETLLNGKTYNSVICNKRKNGASYWEEIVINPLHDSNGIIVGFVAIVMDITAEREANLQLSIFMENMEERFIIFDNEFKAEKLFPAKEIWPIPTVEILGKTPHAFLSVKDADDLTELFNKIDNGEPGPYTLYLNFNQPDGSKSIYEFIVSRFNSQKFAVWGRDITDKFRLRILSDFKSNINTLIEANSRMITQLGQINNADTK